MTSSEMLKKIKENLGLLSDNRQDLMISDVILAVCDYCNLDSAFIPDIL